MCELRKLHLYRSDNIHGIYKILHFCCKTSFLSPFFFSSFSLFIFYSSLSYSHPHYFFSLSSFPPLSAFPSLFFRSHNSFYLLFLFFCLSFSSISVLLRSFSSPYIQLLLHSQLSGVNSTWILTYPLYRSRYQRPSEEASIVWPRRHSARLVAFGESKRVRARRISFFSNPWP